MKDKYQGVVCSSGREIYAHHGIIGIDAEGSLHEGYDGCIDGKNMSLEEKCELADFMVKRWETFKRTVSITGM